MKETRSLYRAFFILIFGAFSFQINGQIDAQILKKQWISVQNRYTDKSDGWYVKEANILSFTNNQIEGYYLWDDSLSTFTIEVNDSLIISNDTLDYGKILFLSNDSLLISLEQGKMIVTYIPIIDLGNNISKQYLDTVLTKTAWSKIYPYGELKIDFWNLETSTPMLKYCNAIIENKYNFYQDGGYWSTFEYKGNSFLYLSIDPTAIYETGIFQIIEIDSSIIKTQPLSLIKADFESFMAIENLSKTESDRLNNILSLRQWKVDSIQEMSDYYKFSQTELDELIVPVSRFRKEDWFLKADFHNKKIKYIFDSGGSYRLLIDSTCIVDGTWSLSRDGTYLYLHNKQTGVDVLKILDYDPDQLLIRHKIDLKVSDKTNEVKRFDYIIKLY